MPSLVLLDEKEDVWDEQANLVSAEHHAQVTV